MPLLTENVLLKWKYCDSDFLQKPLTAIQPLVPFEMKGFGSESPGFERKGIPDL